MAPNFYQKGVGSLKSGRCVGIFSRDSESSKITATTFVCSEAKSSNRLKGSTDKPVSGLNETGWKVTEVSTDSLMAGTAGTLPKGKNWVVLVPKVSSKLDVVKVQEVAPNCDTKAGFFLVRLKKDLEKKVF